MALSEKEVRYVAGLAHLKLSEAEVQEFLPQLDSILEYIAKLDELDTKNVEPMTQALAEGSPGFALRADLVRRTFSQAEAVGSAPQQEHGLFKVPRVIERE